MKKIVVTLCLSLLATGVMAGIDSFKDLKKRLLKGDDVKAIIYYDLCLLEHTPPTTTGPDDTGNIGGIKFDSFAIYTPADKSETVIAAASSHLVVRDGTPIKMLHRVRVTEDNFANVGEYEIDPVTNIVSKKRIYKCLVDHNIFFEKM